MQSECLLGAPINKANDSTGMGSLRLALAGKTKVVPCISRDAPFEDENLWGALFGFAKKSRLGSAITATAPINQRFSQVYRDRQERKFYHESFIKPICE